MMTAIEKLICKKLSITLNEEKKRVAAKLFEGFRAFEPQLNKAGWYHAGQHPKNKTFDLYKHKGLPGHGIAVDSNKGTWAHAVNKGGVMTTSQHIVKS